MLLVEKYSHRIADDYIFHDTEGYKSWYHGWNNTRISLPARMRYFNMPYNIIALVSSNFPDFYNPLNTLLVTRTAFYEFPSRKADCLFCVLYTALLLLLYTVLIIPDMMDTCR